MFKLELLKDAETQRQTKTLQENTVQNVFSHFSVHFESVGDEIYRVVTDKETGETFRRHMPSEKIDLTPFVDAENRN